MFVIGLTGGIGSGKTTVGKLFGAKGVTVIDADDVARAVVDIGEPALQKIAERHGSEILLNDGALNRAKLREIVFNNPAEKDWLEQLTHPLITKLTDELVSAAKSDYVIYISPLLIEKGIGNFAQRILVIDCDENTQISRTTERDNNSAELVQAIMNNQATREQRLAHADDVIKNNGDIDTLTPQIERLHQQYLELANA